MTKMDVNKLINDMEVILQNYSFKFDELNLDEQPSKAFFRIYQNKETGEYAWHITSIATSDLKVLREFPVDPDIWEKVDIPVTVIELDTIQKQEETGYGE